MNYLKLGSALFLGGLILFLFFQTKYLKESVRQKEESISTLQLSLQSYEKIRQAEAENSKKNKLLIQELQQERNIFQEEINIKQIKIKEISNDPTIKVWAEQKIPANVLKIIQP